MPAPSTGRGCRWPGGHAYDLAGWEPLPGVLSEAWILALLGAPADAELITYADPGGGAFRYARLVEGRLDACIFLACDGAFLPDRHRLGEMLGASVEGRARLDLVAGLATARADPGPIVCACFAVGLDTLRRAIVDGRLTSLADIATALRAGTNCGSCRPELSELLAAGRTAPAARSAVGCLVITLPRQAGPVEPAARIVLGAGTFRRGLDTRGCPGPARGNDG